MLDFSSSLILEDTWAEWKVSQVSSYSDSSRLDHLSFLWWEIWSIEHILCALSWMIVRLLMAVIVLDDLVHERGEHLVGVMTTSVDTNT